MNEGEKKVVNKMIAIYCRARHHSSGLCEECTSLSHYAVKRLENCPYGDQKPTCGSCPVHCYKSDMRMRIQEVMRFSGPRMFFRHPVDTIRHFYQEYQRKRCYASAGKFPPK